MDEKANHRFGILQRAEFLIKFIKYGSQEELLVGLSASQLQELRNFLENELLYLTSMNGRSLSRDRVKSKYPSVHDYYYRYDCRETLDSCYNETCLGLNPNCFSRKMREQIKVLLELLGPYLMEKNEAEAEFEHRKIEW